jgi:hypothetical protein
MSKNDDGMSLEISAAPSTLALLNASEIDMQIATAHKFPRSIKQFRTDVMDMVTLSESIAQECIYALPRDGKVIEGPSARFAEVVANAWGNSRAGARVVSDQGDFITAQGVFHDLQKNVAITYEVQRRITNSRGNRYGADMIGVTGNAASSIALRNAILKGVPKAYWADMYAAARRVAMGDIKTLPTRRAEAFKAFLGYGVSKEAILLKLQLAGEEDIGQDELVILRGILTAIRDGDTTPEQAFAPEVDQAPSKPARKSDAPTPPPPPPAAAAASTTSPDDALDQAALQLRDQMNAAVKMATAKQAVNEMLAAALPDEPLTPAKAAPADEPPWEDTPASPSPQPSPPPPPPPAATTAGTGDFASPGQRAHLISLATRNKKNMRLVLDVLNMEKVNHITLEDISQEQFDKIKATLTRP